MLGKKIFSRQSGIIVYGITPPKKDTSPERIETLSKKQVERIGALNVDGLVLYDLQDEKDRNPKDRPFPFLETLDPMYYSNKYLGDLKIPKIIYRCVGKYTAAQFPEMIAPTNGQNDFSVFVGASSREQKVFLRLSEAYEIYQNMTHRPTLGGVLIPERHMIKSDEHLRIISKMEKGCKYFISQAVYNLEASKNFLSDYYYYCKSENIEMVPIIFTLTPCGSKKTLEFLKWLGISIPRWLENDLKNSKDILSESLSLCKSIFGSLLNFCIQKKIPIGCNIESVSIRKVEIEASITLAKDIKNMMGQL